MIKALVYWTRATILLAVIGFGVKASATVVVFQEDLTTDGIYIEDGTNAGMVFNTGTLRAQTDALTQRILLSFTDVFGNGVGQVPLGSTINSAMLTLTTGTSGASTSSDTINFHEVSTAWNESTTWNSFNSGGMAGIDYSSTVVGSIVSPDTTSTAYSATVTTAVQNWSNGTTNLGLIGISDGVDGVRFISDNAGTASSPKLTVDFTAVPEPSAFFFLALASLVIAGRRCIFAHLVAAVKRTIYV